MLNDVQILAIAILPFVFAITLHETAHGWVAKQLGDPTAQMMGRLTLNPIKHIDIVGTILVPAGLWLTTGFVFGWAKPVPITWENLKRPKRDVGLVAIAGPLANLLMVIFWALIMKLGLLLAPSYSYFGIPLTYMGMAGVIINSVLMILNLIPLPPLDGGRIVSSLLPGPLAWKYNKIEPFGIFILLGLLISGVLGAIVVPPFLAFVKAIEFLFGLYPLLSRLLTI